MKISVGEAIINALKAQNIAKLTANFSGGGDSGEISEILYERLNAEGELESVEIDDVAISYVRRVVHNSWSGGTVESTVEVFEVESTLAKAVDEMVMAEIDKTGVDWYNNDGGGGEYVINLIEGTHYLNVDVNYMETKSEYCEEQSLDAWFTNSEVLASADELNDLESLVAL